MERTVLALDDGKKREERGDGGEDDEDEDGDEWAILVGEQTGGGGRRTKRGAGGAFGWAVDSRVAVTQREISGVRIKWAFLAEGAEDYTGLVPSTSHIRFPRRSSCDLAHTAPVPIFSLCLREEQSKAGKNKNEQLPSSALQNLRWSANQPPRKRIPKKSTQKKARGHHSTLWAFGRPRGICLAMANGDLRGNSFSLSIDGWATALCDSLPLAGHILFAFRRSTSASWQQPSLASDGWAGLNFAVLHHSDWFACWFCAELGLVPSARLVPARRTEHDTFATCTFERNHARYRRRRDITLWKEQLIEEHRTQAKKACR